MDSKESSAAKQEQVSFGYPVTSEILHELAAVVAVEFGSALRDVFHVGAGKSVLATSGTFTYQRDLIRSHADPTHAVSFLFVPDKKHGTHCMVLLPVDSSHIGLIFTSGDDPLMPRLYQFSSRLLVRIHLERTKAILDSRKRLLDLQGKYDARTRELEQAEQARGRLEERVRQLNDELDAVTHQRGAGDMARLIKVARGYQQELQRVKVEFSEVVANNGRLFDEIQELNAICIPKIAEYETIVHDLRSRMNQLEAGRAAAESAVLEAEQMSGKVVKSQVTIENLRAQLAQARAEATEQIRQLQSSRGAQAVAALQKRLAEAEGESTRLRQSLERITTGTAAIRTRLAEQEQTVAKYDALLRVSREILNIAANYQQYGVEPPAVLETIRSRVAGLV
ncbi:MAG: hypothetical protein HYX75_15715 [Acidobacteria bacterium]|nr:hypothetical protein [Acidobacteriota bacterium]